MALNTEYFRQDKVGAALWDSYLMAQGEVDRLHARLVSAMAAHQVGEGPAPLPLSFERWVNAIALRDLLKQRLALRGMAA